MTRRPSVIPRLTTRSDVPGQVPIALRPVDGAVDRPMLARWLVMDHVRRWWGDPALNLADFDEMPAARHLIVVADGAPIGYIRWRHVRRQDLSETGVPVIPDGAVDIDLFIGEPEWLGRGAGSAALLLLLERLRADPPAPFASVSTSVQNARAIRAYEKAGFRRHLQYDDSDSGTSWIMLAPLRPPALATSDALVP